LEFERHIYTTTHLRRCGTAGYEWNYDVEGEYGVTEISQRSGQEEDEDNIIIQMTMTNNLLLAKTSMRIFVIRGIHVGRAPVHLMQRRMRN
jgi:hypothetical protein